MYTHTCICILYVCLFVYVYLLVCLYVCICIFMCESETSIMGLEHESKNVVLAYNIFTSLWVLFYPVFALIIANSQEKIFIIIFPFILWENASCDSLKCLTKSKICGVFTFSVFIIIMFWRHTQIHLSYNVFIPSLIQTT